MSSEPLITRVAPSPTGDPHVGTAYMALFCLALARTTGGRFILRIEDTDRTRYQADSEPKIIESLGWLGLDYDEGPDIGGPNGPYRQSERTEIYREHVDRLLDGGKAYRCFCSSRRLAEMRRDQRASKAPGGYDGHCRDLEPEEIEKRLADDVPFVVRLRVPKDRKVAFTDELRGTVEIDGKEVDDQVLLKSDGFPTYHLANVVDDHLMEVNEVVRAEEWISSTPKHVILYEAFGWELPRFRHMPLLRNKDRSKISKRKNPTSLLWYKEHGYLPEALVNFLGLMGYSSPDGEEMFSRDQMLADFDTKRMSTTGPVFDLEKLGWLNGEYIRADGGEKLARRLIDHWAYRAATDHEPDPAVDGPLYDWIRAHGGFESEAVEQFVLATIPLVQPRLKTLEEYGRVTRCFFLTDVAGYAVEDLVPKKRDLAGTQEVLQAAHVELDTLEYWTTAGIEQVLRGLLDPTGWKAREVFQAVRVAVTGSKVSPPLFESMELIGKPVCLARLEAALKL